MKWEEEVSHTKVESRTEISSLWKIANSNDSENAWGLYLSSRPTILVFESLNSELKWERYDQNKKSKVV